MVQDNLFPQNANKGKQPQRTASRPPAGQPAANLNRQAATTANRPVQFPQTQYPYPRQGNPNNAAYPPSRSDVLQDGNIRLFGWVGRYFQVRQTATGKSLATFSLATQTPYLDESGNWLKRTVWQRIVAWGETAEAIAQRLSKGARVRVVGKFKTREWTDRENTLHTTTELVARHVEFLDPAAA